MRAVKRQGVVKGWVEGMGAEWGTGRWAGKRAPVQEKGSLVGGGRASVWGTLSLMCLMDLCLELWAEAWPEVQL